MTPKTFFRLSLLFTMSLAFCTPASCQIKETIDKDIVLIKYVPYGKDNGKQNRKFKKQNHEYREILAIDTLAIPYLIDKISDTTQTDISIPCSIHKLKIGDVAFALLNDIVIIPWHAAFGIDGDAYGCDSLPLGGWEDVYNNRIKFQKDLKIFFSSAKGKAWVKLFKGTPIKTERDKLIKQL